MNKHKPFPCPIVVIGGGECAGKSTALPRMIEIATKHGLTPLLLPEIATQLFSAGIDFRNGNLEPIEFQDFVIEATLSAEELLAKTANRMKERGREPIIFCDRGLADGRIYVGDEAYERLLARHGLTPDSVLARYDAVFHLVTAAEGAPAFYQQTGNRLQTPEEAIANDHALRKVWMGSQHFRLIRNIGTFEDKLHELECEFLAFLGKPLPLERERKFLVPLDDVMAMLSVKPHHVLGIEQRYLVSDLSRSGFSKPRLRRLISLANNAETDIAYFLTEKQDTDNPEVRIERSERCSKEEYEIFKRLHNPHTKVIRKNRHYVLENDRYCEIDVFLGIDFPEHPDVQGVVALVEIELTEEQSFLEKPSWASRWVEVTDNPAYRNESLAGVIS